MRELMESIVADVVRDSMEWKTTLFPGEKRTNFERHFVTELVVVLSFRPGPSDPHMYFECYGDRLKMLKKQYPYTAVTAQHDFIYLFRK